MDKLSNLSKSLIGIGAVAIVLAIAVFYENTKNGTQIPVTPNGSTSTANYGTAGDAFIATSSNSLATGTANNGTSANPSSRQNGNSPSETAGPSISHNAKIPIVLISFITPVPNDEWTIGVANPVSWRNAPKTTGEIDLLDSNGEFVGVILSDVTATQTSYTWDTRQIYLSRFSPVKKDIVPGDYMIRLKFDGNGQPNVYSKVFTISK